MKNNLFFIYFLILSAAVNAQTLDWFAASKSSYGNYPGMGLETDHAGNVYFTSYSRDSMQFFSQNFNSSVDNLHIYKVSSAGNLIWRKDLLSNTPNSGGITMDSHDNIYVYGYAGRTPITYDGAVFTPNDTMDNAFIMKLDSDGNLIFFKYFSGKLNYIQDLKVDANENIFVTGNYEKEFNLIDTVITSTVYDSTSFLQDSVVHYSYIYRRNSFVAKFDAACNLLNVNVFAIDLDGWNAGGTTELALDPSGTAVYVAGAFRNAINIANQWVNSSGNSDMILIKLTNDCNVMWYRKDVSLSGVMVSDLKADQYGGVYLSGSYFDVTSFGGLTINPIGTSYSDCFLLKYSEDGNALWIKTAGSNTYVSDARKIELTSNGDVFWCGAYPDNTTIGNTVINVATGPVYNINTFVAKYSLNGDFKNVFTINSNYQTDPSEIKVDGNSIYVSGLYRDNLIFNNNVIAIQPAITNGDMYLMKLALTPATASNCIAYYTSDYDPGQNSFNLTVDSTTLASATSYFWDFGDGTTSTLALPSHFYNVDSVYNVCMSIQNSLGEVCTYCNLIGKDSLGNIVRNNGFSLNVRNTVTGIPAKESNKLNVSVYPNPAIDEAVIILDKKRDNVTLKIYNTKGQLISQTKEKSGDHFIINVSNEPAGMYFIEINNGEQSIRRKLIKN